MMRATTQIKVAKLAIWLRLMSKGNKLESFVVNLGSQTYPSVGLSTIRSQC